MKDGNPIFSNLPDYFEENKKQIEDLKKFYSFPNSSQNIKEKWLKNNKVSKYKMLFEEFVKKIDGTNIPFEEKDDFLNNLEKLLLYYEEEILMNDKEVEREIKYKYDKRVEESLIFEENIDFENLEKEIKILEEEIKRNEQILNEKKSIKIEIDPLQNESIIKLSARINELINLKKSQEGDINQLNKTIMVNTKKIQELQNEINIDQNQFDLKAYNIMILECKSRIISLIHNNLEPLYKKKLYFFYLFKKHLMEQKNFIEEIKCIKKKTEEQKEELNKILQQNKIIEKKHINCQNQIIESQEKQNDLIVEFEEKNIFSINYIKKKSNLIMKKE